MLNTAIKIAKEAHKNQVDKGGNDYFNHLVSVMNKMDTDFEKTCAILHDILEDTYITKDILLEEGISIDVIDIVEILTRKHNEDYFKYIERILSNKIASKIKLADLEDNMNLSRIKEPTVKDYKRLEKYKRAKEMIIGKIDVD